ncbi:MAG TPA: PP2C family protein-serine/threonine phosphatase [Candidatus Sulfotelmatobacter sp.]|nr:PP2C family protein-serine/threonine phosphatase [Candidatus Sulfotelmatobacter sp.]
MSTQSPAEICPCCQHDHTADRTAAQELQRSLIPTANMKSTRFEVASRFTPFSDVSGDFMDFFNLPSGLIGLYVGDVVGKGLAAAMYAALVMGTLRGINKTGETTAAVLALLNRRLLVRPIAGRYCATLYALFDPSTRELTFSNAGLPRPLLACASGCRELGEGGLPSGLFPESSYEIHTVRLAPGDVVLFATDGLTEIRNHWDEDFGWERLGELWAPCAEKSAEQSLELLFEGLDAFSMHTEQRDDITAVVLKVPVHVEAQPELATK